MAGFVPKSVVEDIGKGMSGINDSLFKILQIREGREERKMRERALSLRRKKLEGQAAQEAQLIKDRAGVVKYLFPKWDNKKVMTISKNKKAYDEALNKGFENKAVNQWSDEMSTLSEKVLTGETMSNEDMSLLADIQNSAPMRMAFKVRLNSMKREEKEEAIRNSLEVRDDELITIQEDVSNLAREIDALGKDDPKRKSKIQKIRELSKKYQGLLTRKVNEEFYNIDQDDMTFAERMLSYIMMGDGINGK